MMGGELGEELVATISWRKSSIHEKLIDYMLIMTEGCISLLC
jgi:hypothetical protein